MSISKGIICQIQRHQAHQQKRYLKRQNLPFVQMYVTYVIVVVGPGTQAVTCAAAAAVGSLLTRRGGKSPGVGAARLPVTVGKAIGGSEMPLLPTKVRHIAGSWPWPQKSSSFQAKSGIYGSPAFTLALEGGHGRSARLKDCWLPWSSSVLRESGWKEVVEVAYERVRLQ